MEEGRDACAVWGRMYRSVQLKRWGVGRWRGGSVCGRWTCRERGRECVERMMGLVSRGGWVGGGRWGELEHGKVSWTS